MERATLDDHTTGMGPEILRTLYCNRVAARNPDSDVIMIHPVVESKTLHAFVGEMLAYTQVASKVRIVPNGLPAFGATHNLLEAIMDRSLLEQLRRSPDALHALIPIESTPAWAPVKVFLADLIAEASTVAGWANLDEKLGGTTHFRRREIFVAYVLWFLSQIHPTMEAAFRYLPKSPWPVSERAGTELLEMLAREIVFKEYVNNHASEIACLLTFDSLDRAVNAKIVSNAVDLVCLISRILIEYTYRTISDDAAQLLLDQIAAERTAKSPAFEVRTDSEPGTATPCSSLGDFDVWNGETIDAMFAECLS